MSPRISRGGPRLLLLAAVAASLGCAGERRGHPPLPPNTTAQPSSVGSSGGAGAVGGSTSAPWAGPAAPFVFVEGESFTTTGKGWKALRSAGGVVDRERASGATVLSGWLPGGGTAEADVVIPAAGTYRVWVRASRRSETHADGNAFVLRISQAGRAPASTTIDPGPAKVTEEDFAWVPMDAPLGAGPAHITLEKDAKPSVHVTLRRVDCVMLTKDLSYVPDLRDFGPQLYVRAHVISARPHPVSLLEAVQTSGGTRTQPIKGARKPGDVSAWSNITRLLRGESGAVYTVLDVSRADEARLDVDFATQPDPASILKTVHRDRANYDPVAWIPASFGPSDLPRTPEELARERAAEVAVLPPVSFGRRPVAFPVMTGFQVPPEAFSDELRVLEYVGINSQNGVLTDRDRSAGFVFSRLYQTAYLPGDPPFIHPDYERVKAGMQRSAQTLPPGVRGDQFLYALLMDEGSPATLDKLASSDVANEAFRRWLDQQHLQPFGPGEAKGEIRLVASRDTPHPGLYFYSQRFRASTIVDYFKRVTQMAHAVYPPGMRTTQNFSDGAVFRGSMYTQGNDYFDYFSQGALDVAQSEDWTNSGATHELCGWNVALLRAATQAHHEPIHMTVIAAGRGPLLGKLKASTDVSEGAQGLNLYNYGARYASPQEPGWAETPELMPALGELVHEIGAVDELLAQARRDPSDTAILYSIPADIWNVDDDVTQGFDRMGTYLALRHAQVPVDVLGDEQARTGLLARYKVIFLPTEQLDQRNVAPLATWVRNGGTLVLGPGAGKRDEWNRATNSLDAALGVNTSAADVSQGTRGLPGATYCESAKATGMVRVNSATGDIPVFGSRVPVAVPTGGKAVAEFADHQPAGFTFGRGRGRVVVLGFQPGLAYLCGARKSFAASDAKELVPPLRIVAQALVALGKNHEAAEAIRQPREQAYGQLPFRYDSSLREFITSFALGAGVSRPVSVDRAQVEATLLEGPRGWVIPLANYTGAPLDRIVVTIRGSRAFRGLRSARLGEIPGQHLSDGSVEVSLPLESTDYLAGEWQ